MEKDRQTDRWTEGQIDGQTDTDRQRQDKTGISVATISHRHLEVALWSTNMNCVGKEGANSPVDVQEALDLKTSHKIFVLVHPLDYLLWDSQKHISGATFCSGTRNRQT